MLAELHYPSIFLHGEDLDEYLAKGWFRMGQSIFTTNFLKFKGLFYNAIWLRIDLDTFTPSKSQEKLIKLNTQFRVEIKPLSEITSEHTELFSKYKTHITFDAAPSITQLLFDNESSNVFDTQQVCIYDQNKLIACGILDLGQTSSAGIVCFYDPDYKKHSLGKYLMFLKIDFCQKHGMKFFYPGYFAPNYPLFDYKLELAKPSLEYLELGSNQWKSIEEYTFADTPLVVMTRKLNELSTYFKQWNFEHKFFYYDYFDADLMASLNGLGLFDFPVFLFCLEIGDLKNIPIIVYDVQSLQYHLLLCDAPYTIDRQFEKEDLFNKNLLRMTKHLFSSESAEVMAKVLAMSWERTAISQS
jgi:leucyl-tRNA---protein transferase